MCPQQDFSSESWSDFFEKMETQRLIRLVDNRGNNITLDQMPTRIADIVNDDPYRSLMEYVCVVG